MHGQGQVMGVMPGRSLCYALRCLLRANKIQSIICFGKAKSHVAPQLRCRKTFELPADEPLHVVHSVCGPDAAPCVAVVGALAERENGFDPLCMPVLAAAVF